MSETNELRSWLERLEGREVKEVYKYDCDQHSGEELPQVVVFRDGDEAVWCDYLDLGICSKCEYFRPLKSAYSQG